MKIQHLTESATIRSEVKGAHNGQVDFTLYIEDDGKVLGKLDAVEFDKKPSINMIDVYVKGNGNGKQLVKHLQSLYPDQEIEWGMTTDEGEALRKSLKYTKVKTEYYDQFKKYHDTKAKLEDLQAKADAFHEIVQPSEEHKQAFFKIIEPMNDLHDEVSDLEEILRDEKPYHHVIVY